MKHVLLTKLLLWLLLFVFLQTKAVQANTSLPPAVDFHIEKTFTSQELPALKWVLEEGYESLTAEDLFAGRQKDAKLIDLSESPVFDMKAHYNYWFKIKLTSAVELDEFGIAFFWVGNKWPFEFTFKEVETFSQNSNKIGKSGTTFPASQRDYPQIINPSIVRTQLENDTLVQWIKVTMAERGALKVRMSLMSNSKIESPLELNNFTGPHMLLNGAMIALFFLALLLFFWFQDWVYCWFMLFQFFLLTSTVSLYFPNEIFNALFPEDPRTMVFTATMLHFLRILALLQFGRVYIVTKTKFPKLHRVLGIALWSLFAMTALGLFFRTYFFEIGNSWFQIRQLPMGITMTAILISLIYFCLLYTSPSPRD